MASTPLPLPPAFVGSGGRVLVASPTVETLEGDWFGNWTVVIEFPSEEAGLEEWYLDEIYQQAVQLRLASTSLNNLVVAPGFVPPADIRVGYVPKTVPSWKGEPSVPMPTSSPGTSRRSLLRFGPRDRSCRATSPMD